MIYAYAALQTGTPYANGAPNLSADIPALVELAQKNKVPVTGKDFKTGQTFMKTIVAPGLKARMLGVSGWFSTNILGNRDGEVLDDPGLVPDQGSDARPACSDTSCSPSFIPSCTSRSSTRSELNTIRPGATRRRVGTTSISLGGADADADQDQFSLP